MPRKKKIPLNELVAAANHYADTAPIPIVKEFALQVGYAREYLYELASLHPKSGLREALQRIIDQKEIILEKGALTGALDRSMAIFSLKQIGWRDQPPERKNDDKIDALLRSITDAANNQQ